MSNTIILGGNPQKFEEIAAEAITPGHLIEYVPSGGDAGQVRKHAGAGLMAAPMFAVENIVPDRSVATAPVDTPYADGEQCQFMFGRPGDQVYAWLDNGGTAVVKGDFLQSSGDGTLIEHVPQAVDEGGTATYTIYSNAVVAVAMEAVDNSGGSAPVRIKVRVL